MVYDRSDIMTVDITMDDLEASAEGTLEDKHIVFLSHYKLEAGTEATLMKDAMERMPHPQYVKEAAHHQAVLSPPGNGYDCYRTWEALMIGSVPLVMADSKYDQRLFEDSGAVVIPAPFELTPEKLEKILNELPDPAPFRNKLSVKWWKEQWLKPLA